MGIETFKGDSLKSKFKVVISIITIIVMCFSFFSFSPMKSEAATYKTRSIVKEKLTIRSAQTGKVIKDNGFDMICRVVNAEVGPAWSFEALKAQAVAAYTVIRYNNARGYIPMLGYKKGCAQNIRKAVKAVQGLVCTYNGKMINAVFGASTAGRSSSAANMWGGTGTPYLKSVSSKYDYLDPNYGVKYTLSKAKMKTYLTKRTGVKLPSDPKKWLVVKSRHDGKYVNTVSVGGKKILTGSRIQETVLPELRLRSTAFYVSYTGGKFVFKTYGYGHCVGLSQWGAHYYATKGKYKFDRILKHYYQGVKIVTSATKK